MQGSQSTYEQTLQATIKYLEGIPTGTDLDSATENIQAWEQTLRDSGQTELLVIADELRQLQDLLSASDFDGVAIGSSLLTLGNHTETAATSADPQVADELQQLGKWLKKVGTDLQAE